MINYKHNMIIFNEKYYKFIMRILDCFFYMVISGFIIAPIAHAQVHDEQNDQPTVSKKNMAIGVYVAYRNLGVTARYGPLQVTAGGYFDFSGETPRDWLLHLDGRYNYTILARKRIDLRFFCAVTLAQYERHSYTETYVSYAVETMEEKSITLVYPYRSSMIVSVGIGPVSEIYFFRHRKGFSISIETGIGSVLLGRPHWYRGFADVGYPFSAFTGVGLHYHL